MKHIKLFENFETNSIDDICKYYGIKNYTINEDDSIDVDGDVRLGGWNLDIIPLKFNKVNGNFSIANNNITSLDGCPKIVNGYFYCYVNNLNSLKGAPLTVGGNFYCNNNNLENLEYFPNFIGGSFGCCENHGLMIYGINDKVDGDVICDPDKEIIYNIFVDNLDYLNNFYNFNILSNIGSEYVLPNLNLKRLKRFIELYDLNELTNDQINDLKKYYHVYEK